MEREAWLARYKQRLIDEYGFTEHGAALNAEDIDLDDINDAFEEDPEGCADEEMLEDPEPEEDDSDWDDEEEEDEEFDDDDDRRW